MINLETKQKWTKRIEYCIKNKNKLNDWEFGFIKDIWNRWCYCNMELTIKQSFKLNKIFYKIETEDI